MMLNGSSAVDRRAPARIIRRVPPRVRAAAAVFLALAAAVILPSPPAAATRTQDRRDNSQPPNAQKQQPPGNPAGGAAEILPEDPDDVLTIDTNLVPVDVTVTDAEGRPVRDLRPEDFKLYEDGVERPISFFNVERRSGAKRPVAVVFLVDVSGSVSPEEVSRITRAMRAFSTSLYERDSVFALVSFGMRVRVLQDFTANAEKLERAYRKLEREPNGLSTHTYDAVDDAVRLLKRHAPRSRNRRLLKRAVVVVTDGFPVGDTVSPKTVIERANAEEVSVYTVTLPSFPRFMTSAADAPLPTPLDVSGLAEKTGGSNLYATAQNFEPLFKSLADEVVSTYVLAFYPPEVNRRDGRYRQIRVTTRPGLSVRQSRPGYKN